MGSAGELVGGRYRLVEQIGQGGMGRVWRSRDETLDREVAVKELLLPPGITEEDRRTLIQRVMREARIAARLNHPGIVAVHDLAEHGGAPVIVMEYVPGRSLQARIKELGPFVPEAVAAIGAAVLDALMHAHEAGVVHRDLKPDNILLAPRRTVITDFGIARLLDGSTALTGTGLALGTPQYMSPEQLEGRELTAACDLWSLGATLYAAVEGAPPFAANSLTAIYAAILTKPLPPPRQAGALEPILVGLLAKDPAERVTAAWALEQLRTFGSAFSGSAVTDLARKPPAASTPPAAVPTPYIQVAPSTPDSQSGFPAVADADPRQAIGERLAWAESLAGTIADPGLRARALGRIARAAGTMFGPEHPQRLIDHAALASAGVVGAAGKAESLAAVARLIASVAPERSARLLDEAEATAAAMPAADRQEVLAALAKAVAGTDAERALRLAQAVKLASLRTSTVTAVAKALAAVHPDRAVVVAHSIEDRHERRQALTIVARVLAGTDPLRAEAVMDSDDARSGRETENRSALVQMLAPVQPQRAEAVAAAIGDKSARRRALITVALAYAPTDPARAEHLVNTIPATAGTVAEAKANLARILASTQPDRAERTAMEIRDGYYKNRALAAVAEAVAATDPGRAARIAGALSDLEAKVRMLASVAAAVGRRDPAYAGALVNQAQHLADSITDRFAQAAALATVAAAAAGFDPNRAEQVAAAISDRYAKPDALAPAVKALAVNDLGVAYRVANRAEHSTRSALLYILVGAVAEPGH